MVVPLGFEPKLTVSKTAVLPLHHGTVAGLCLRANRPFYEFFFVLRSGVIHHEEQEGHEVETQISRISTDLQHKFNNQRLSSFLRAQHAEANASGADSEGGEAELPHGLLVNQAAEQGYVGAAFW